MEEHHQRSEPMDIEQPGSPFLPSTAYKDPWYSHPELEGYTNERTKLRIDDDKDKEENDKKKAARHKAKNKAKNEVKTPTSQEDDNDETDEGKERMLIRRKAKGKARAYSPLEKDDKDGKKRPRLSSSARRPDPLASHPTVGEVTSMDVDDYPAGYDLRFGDTDATMNQNLSSPSSPSSPSSSYNYEADIENDPFTNSAVRIPGRRGLVKPGKLATLQQQQAIGSWGRVTGRGIGEGWGLGWQETITQQKVEQEGWGAYDVPHPSPVDAEMEWESYDESAWERAANRAKEQEAGEVKLKTPSVIDMQGSGKHSADSSRVADGNPTTQSRELVRAVRDYKAILSGTYLTYEKDDVMNVVHRDREGKLFTLLPLNKQPAWSGLAHTKNFVPVSAADEDVCLKEVGGAGAERKGG